MGHTEKQHQAHNWYDNFKNITYTLLRKIIVNNKFVPPPPSPEYATRRNTKSRCEGFGALKTL